MVDEERERSEAAVKRAVEQTQSQVQNRMEDIFKVSDKCTTNPS